MAGSVIGVGIVSCVATLTLGYAAVGTAAVTGQRAAAAADAAALAAADTASGAVAGDPCDRAGEVAAASGGSVTSCRLDVLTATVGVSIPFGPLTAAATARAGPRP